MGKDTASINRLARLLRDRDRIEAEISAMLVSPGKRGKRPGRRFKKWTPAETKKAERLQAEGRSYDEIAEELGRSYDAVRVRLLRQDGKCLNKQ